MNFKELLTLAQRNETFAVNEIVDMYKPLLIKESIIDGIFDEDLYQELTITLIHCIRKIKYKILKMCSDFDFFLMFI